MTEDEMKLDMLVAELDYENRLLRARNERLEKLQSSQEPVAIFSPSKKNCLVIGQSNWRVGTQDWEYLYTSPKPEKPWINLTAQEMSDITRIPIGTFQIMLKVAEKLKEKNGY